MKKLYNLQRLAFTSKLSFHCNRYRALLLMACFAIGVLAAASGPVQAQATIQSDDFAACELASEWTFVAGQNGDPLPTFANGMLTLAVPGNSSHDIWTDELSVSRLTQVVDNSNFEVEIKYASPMSKEFQTRGILVEQTNGDRLRFELLHNGTNYVLLAASMWKFVGWSGDVIGNSNPATLLMDGNKSVTATFEPIEVTTFTLNTQEQGNGTVMADPALSSYA